jgi:acetoin utilization protein AcuC
VSESVALVRVDDVAKAYDFGASHPLRPERVLLTYDRIEQLGLDRLSHVTGIRSRSASEEEIIAVHDPMFVAAVQGIDDGSIERWAGIEFGLGTPDNPIFAGMHDAAAAVSGASVVAAEAVCSGRAQHSFNPAGGLHHARRSEASGFCIYDDPAVAIAKILDVKPSWRVMYVDVDVHHGDGVQWIFYDDPRVLTVSFHQSGTTLYPGTGFTDEIGERDATGTSANVPLEPGTGEDDYLWALRRVVDALARAFAPDVLFTQLGADTHHGDPLANLALTMPAYPRISALLHATAHTFTKGRWIATGGGGYQATTVVPMVWTMHFAEMCGTPEAIPEQWLADRRAKPSRPDSKQRIAASVARVLELCVPRLTEIRAAAP